MNAFDAAFVGMPKIARFSRECIVTEKIDGTNAQIWIPTDMQMSEMAPSHRPVTGFHCGSKSRWITPAQDNHGFARWAWANSDELLKLGPGHHFGEWWGRGIQRNYGLTEQRFSLFNVERWSDEKGMRPACCSIVPVLFKGNFAMLNTQAYLSDLVIGGSVAAPGWMQPEGIVIFHTAANQSFKRTIFDDEKPKGKV